MNICPTCGKSEIKQGEKTEVFENNGYTLVIKGVPCEICPECGETLINSDIWEKVEKIVDLWNKNRINPPDFVIDYKQVA